MTGCVGKSTNSDVSKRILSDLAESCVGGLASSGGITVSVDGTIAEYAVLAPEYNATTQDELVLKMLRKHIDDLLSPDSAYLSLESIREVIELINYSDHSFAAGTKDTLWLRRDGKTLHVIDLRQTLGQVFFFPESKHWQQIYAKYAEFVPDGQKIIEFPDNQVWKLEYTGGEKYSGFSVKKYSINKTKYYDHPVGGYITSGASSQKAEVVAASV